MDGKEDRRRALPQRGKAMNPLSNTGRLSRRRASRPRRRCSDQRPKDGEANACRRRSNIPKSAKVSAGLAAAAVAALAASTSMPTCNAFVGTSINKGGAVLSSAYHVRPGTYKHVPVRKKSPLFSDLSPSSSSTGTSSSSSSSSSRTSAATPAAPRRYVRVEPKGTASRSNGKRRYEVQTAVTTFAKVDPNTGRRITVDLHAQLHFGSQSYYSYYNDRTSFGSRYDRTLYELVVSQDMIDVQDNDIGGTTTTSGSRIRRIKPAAGGFCPIMASPADSNTARSYDLKCQADMINYAQKDWVNADLTREEFIAETQRAAAPIEGREYESTQQQQQQQPLWALASTAAVFPGSEFVSALLRPSTPSTGGSMSASVTRRLFSNLFLPGDALAGLIRAVLWLAVPAPEVSILLLDWSSLTPRPTGGISPIALPVMECLLSGNVKDARKLVFGQMVVSGQASDAAAQQKGSSSNADSSSVLIGKRNERAIDVLQTSIERDGCQSNALLYGASHCLDLQRKLKGLGFSPAKTVWRTAWSVDVPAFGLGRSKEGSSGLNGNNRDLLPAFVSDLTSSRATNGIAVALIVLPLYLAVGGFDWVATIGEVGGAIGMGEVGDGMLEAALYLVRHAALYLGLAKFVVEWDGQNNLFGGDPDRR